MLKSYRLEETLQTYFHYSSFRKGQREIIEDVLQGNDVLGVLPTGSGKSICFQLPALLLDGLTIIVSPLISLMIDQVKELKAKNFKQVAALNSFVDYEQRQYILNNLNQYKLLYISPELLQQEELMHQLSKHKISLFVIDEAHCISQWGHEFRPDYLKLGDTIHQVNNPPVLALSATATPAVQEDIIHTLNRKKMKKRIYPMDRSNLTFVVEELSSEREKLQWLTTYLQKDYGSTLIYFSSRLQAEKTARILLEELPGVKAAFYHGGMEQIDRVAIQQQFMNEQLDIICCTNAFGMGINKQNIRLVIHFHLPSQMEGYIQEVGRAGRDGLPSICFLLYAPHDSAIPRNLIQNELPTDDELRIVMQQLIQMSKQEIKLPTRHIEAAELFQISEIKWRFLRFHFEKHGMISGKNIIYDRNSWQAVFNYLINWIDNRILHKEQKLQEMIQWAESNLCLREGLYRKFQTGFDEPLFQCCSNCGVDLSEWKPRVSSRNTKNEQIDWKTRLRLLLIGEDNETK